MKRISMYLGVMVCFLVGCSEKTQEDVEVEAMVRLEDEESPEWSVPQTNALAGEPGSEQELPMVEGEFSSENQEEELK